MLDVAKSMANNMNQSRTNCTFWQDTSSIVHRLEKLQETFDLALISFTLSELVSD